MRFLLLLVFLDLVHNTQCSLMLFKDFSSWILSYESPMEKPPPPTTMYEDFSSWIDNILSHGRPVEEPPPPPPTMVEEFLYWISNILSVPNPPAHRRTRERCTGNNPSESTGPREKPSIMKMIYTSISAKVFGEPPPPAVPIGCMVTLRDRVISGAIFGLVISPICALVLLAAWLAHEEKLSSEPANSSDVDDLQPDLEAEQDPVRAADVPEPSPPPETAEDLNVPEAATSGEPEQSRPRKSTLKAPSLRGTTISLKHASFNKEVHIRFIPPNHRNEKARISTKHREREFVLDPPSVHDLELLEDCVTELRQQRHPANLSPGRRISRRFVQFLRFFWCCAEQEEN
ncbi:uncharacterized protein [Dendropsophus ebraccatus]|uniref:uncharacterized protein isoform X1 n=1 Tax=Dendropsophus ebraccatus TaxID=150705 RepID=UPI0038318140